MGNLSLAYYGRRMCCYPGQSGHEILEFFKEKMFSQKHIGMISAVIWKQRRHFFFFFLAHLLVFIELPIHAHGTHQEHGKNQADT